MMPAKPAVAIIDNAVNRAIYRPVEHWSAYLDVPWTAYDARRGVLPGPGAHSHIILTGSESSILEREPWVEEEAEYVRRAVDKGAVVLGSCWGHQLLVYALAGAEHVRRSPHPEIGWVEITVDPASDLLGPAGPAYVFSVHYDEVRHLPEDFGVLARSEGCRVQALKLKGRPVWGLQCHPEVDIPAGRRFLRDLIESGFKGSEFLRQALETTPRDSGLIRRIVRTFLDARPSTQGKC